MPSEVYGKATTTYIGGYYEWIGSTNTQTQYYTAGGSTVAIRKGSTLNYLLADHLGSTYATVDTLSGRKLVQRLYMPWGEDRNSKGTLPTTVKYTGQQEEAGIGLYYYKARWYDSALGRFAQADTDVPESQGVQGLDRYAYVNNSPLRYSDPSGHGWFDAVGQFATGFVLEFARVNNWVGALVAPEAARSLSATSGESGAMLAGRVVADAATVVLGVAAIGGGISIAGGGAAAGCGVTLCLASAPAAVAGIAVAGYGVGTTTSGAAALGNNLGIAYSSRHKNDLEPDPDANGPHSTFKRDPGTGKVTNYRTWAPNPLNPNKPWTEVFGYDATGKSHYNKYLKEYVETPHYHDPKFPGGVRPAE